MAKNTKLYIKSLLFFLAISLLPVAVYATQMLSNLPSRNNYFTGRIDSLNYIKKSLAKDGLAYLVGYGGVGKTQLAKEYAHIHAEEYDLVWWFDLRKNLRPQYENLLTYLSNSGRFNGLISIDVNKIAPSVLIDFTNSLLSNSNRKWLLIYDNMLDKKELKYPRARALDHHIIVTTRERQFLGDNVLVLKPFTQKESVEFLAKIHTKEQSDALTLLSNVLHNYPLALAQISDEILMYREGIISYLEKQRHKEVGSILMQSKITQEYPSDYRKIIYGTLENIEQNDGDAARLLYMLVLLNVDLSKDFLIKLFGAKVEDRLLILSKYGVTKTTTHGGVEVLSIHDILREQAAKRFSSKDGQYKKDIMNVLAGRLSSFYVKKDLDYLKNLTADDDDHITTLYAFIHLVLENDIFNDEVLNSIIIGLKLCRFGRTANYVLYQKICDQILDKNLYLVSHKMKALLFANIVFSDLIFDSKENVVKYEQEMLRLLSLIGKQKHYKEFFLCYTYFSRFYGFLGDMVEARKYLKKAEENIKHADSVYDLLEYWYSLAWVSYEMRDVKVGLEAIEVYRAIGKKVAFSEVQRIAIRNLEIRFLIWSGLTRGIEEELKELIQQIDVYYNNAPSGLKGALETNMAYLNFQEGRYDSAKKYCESAIKTLITVYGKDMLTGRLHILLGKIYEKKGNYKLALKEYHLSIDNHYGVFSHGKAITLYDYGDLLAGLCRVYYSQKNLERSKFYYQKLVANYGLDHELLSVLIKQLPSEYMTLIGRVK